MNRSCISPRSRRPQGGAPTTASAIQRADAIAAHVERNVGPIDSTFTLHGTEDRPVRVDVHHVPPSDPRPFHTLVTSGMPRVELFMLLPPGFGLSAPPIQGGRGSWPLGVVRRLALDSREKSTWLGWGHLVLNGDPPEPYAEGVRFCATLLTHPVSLGSEFAELLIRGRTIRFCQLIPLYPEELRFALRHTPRALLARFAQYQMSDVLDPERRNVCAFGATERFERALGAARAKEASPAST